MIARRGRWIQAFALKLGGDLGLPRRLDLEGYRSVKAFASTSTVVVSSRFAPASLMAFFSSVIVVVGPVLVLACLHPPWGLLAPVEVDTGDYLS